MSLTGAQYLDAYRELFSTSGSADDSLFIKTHEKSYVVQKAADGAANTATTHYFAKTRQQLLVTEAIIIPDSNVATSATDYVTLSLKYDDGAGGAKTTVAAVNTSATGWTAGQPTALSITAANAVIPSGKCLIMDVAKAGAGQSVPYGVFQVTGQPQ